MSLLHGRGRGLAPAAAAAGRLRRGCRDVQASHRKASHARWQGAGAGERCAVATVGASACIARVSNMARAACAAPRRCSIVLDKLLRGGIMRADPSAMREWQQIQGQFQPPDDFRMKVRGTAPPAAACAGLLVGDEVASASGAFRGRPHVRPLAAGSCACARIGRGLGVGVPGTCDPAWKGWHAGWLHRCTCSSRALPAALPCLVGCAPGRAHLLSQPAGCYCRWCT